MPKTLLEALLYPVMGPFRDNEYPAPALQDFQLGLAYAGLCIAGWMLARRRLADMPRPLAIVAAGSLGVLVPWLVLFGIGRYALGVWMLGPLLLVGGLFTLRPDWTRASRAMAWLGGLAPVCLICGLSVHVRRVPLAHPLGAYVSADLPEEIDFENALVLFTGPYPSTFLAPQLPPSAKTAFLFPAAWTDEAIAGLYPLARERIDLAEGPVIAVINTRSDSGLLIGGLHDHYGLAVDETDCRPIPNNMESLDVDWIACPAAKGGA
ncbi:MAG: hypothetical protein KDA53_13190 [Hyphomonas sp.]|nr:hypothetical protein [Hyphomonas sp.]